MHSGRQFGDLPMKEGRQEQTAKLLSAPLWHCELGPHGEGMQGLTGSGSYTIGRSGKF